MDFIIETLIVLILRYPGAGARWLISRLVGSRKGFHEFFKDEPYINATSSLLVIAVLVICIKAIIR